VFTGSLSNNGRRSVPCARFVGICLPSRCLAMGMYIRHTILVSDMVLYITYFQMMTPKLVILLVMMRTVSDMDSVHM
jgi:hypothetical protein